MLEIKDLHVSYGGIQALRGVSLNVPDSKIVTLIGANGAGKSTLMRTISGLVKAQSGSILWNGQELLGKPRSFPAALPCRRRAAGCLPT
jgi:branched-chain amino acid transport system ATP-binding protein